MICSKRFVTVFLCMLIAGAAAVAARVLQERSLLVTVLDKDGVALRDLAPSDFRVTEDGVARTVTGAALSAEPLSVIVLVDTTKSRMGTPEPTRDVRAAVQTFVKTVYAGGQPTQMAIMEYAGAGVMLRGFTDKVADVEKAAGRLVPSQQSTAVLLETLIDAAKEVGKRPGPRRAIVVMDRGSQESSQVRADRITSEIEKSGASVWAVSLAQSSGVSVPARDYALESLTAATGGVRLTGVAPSSLEALMKKIADALVSQYAVTYTSEGSPKVITPGASRGTTVLRAPWIK